ncbi:MAG: SufD family Fe-S cluster assembly protein [Deltaproteobacteria bacterium]|nr:SufD family Fe-S cluster assembly protein [Candidatus Zymogenaceae bacterium]
MSDSIDNKKIVDRFAGEKREHSYIEDLDSVSTADKERMRLAGIDTTTRERSATYLQKDHSLVHCNVTQEGLEVMDIKTALETHGWLNEYVWRLVKPDKDEFTKQADEVPHLGYFIRALPGVKSLSPVQACLYLATDSISQNVHNIIIAEEGSNLHIITGCSTAPGVASGLHIGVSEFYVKKGATVSFTMIHNWSEGVVVRPRSSIRVEENGRFINNYIVLNPVESIQMYPSTHLVGDNAVTSLNSILVAPKGSHLDIGGRAVLSGKNTRAEIIARAITTGGTIYSRGQIVGEVPGVKAHLECKGLILEGGGSIIAIPELEGRAEDLELSHEAAVGRINQSEINYLMARGLTEDEAVGVIVRGFLHVDIEGLPPELKEEISRNIQKSQKEYL